MKNIKHDFEKSKSLDKLDKVLKANNFTKKEIEIAEQKSKIKTLKGNKGENTWENL